MVRLSGSKNSADWTTMHPFKIDLSLRKRLVDLAGWGESLTYT
jgi:hypothetical protein